MPRITISYRRDDSLGVTGRIFDRLAARYGRETVFRDLESVRVGLDFRAQVRKALSETDIVIAVIGPKWLGPRSGNNRLMNGADPVRVEIETALRQEVPLIPVLVSGAAMPSAEKLPDTLNSFAYRNALTIDDGRDFDIHISRLFDAIAEILELEEATSARTVPPEPLMPRPEAPPATVSSASADLAQLVAERDMLRSERDTFVAEVNELRDRERMYAMEVNYTADEAAASQYETDHAELTAALETNRRAFAKRIVVHNFCFVILSAALACLGFYAFMR
ncbi:MAG TPA: toll/interleukin-1 receptor domain-containing protein [Acetobacteraceae bacterium]|nr:toll/interleukin-1 receptor domain-containing protein [Acetobacteraceae bacterium]